MQRRVGFFLGFFLLGCAGGSSTTRHAPASQQCSLRLEPWTQPPSPGPAAAPRSAPLSQIVVHGQAPLSTLTEQLERRVQRRLSEGRFGIGPGGSVSYHAERGALALQVSRNALLVETTVSARAEACRGESCYASCQPEAVVQARVPLLVRPDYGFDPAQVTLRFTRGCKVKALGGFLSIDLTPSLESQLRPELAKVARQIDAQLDNLRADTQRIWTQLATPRELPLGGCLLLQPQSIVQGPLSDSTELVHARFTLLARPELRTRCGDAPALPPLPALERDLGMADEGKLLLGLVTPLAALQSALSGAQPFEIDGRTLRVAAAKLEPLGSDVVAEVELGGDVCGSVRFSARPELPADGKAIGLAKPSWLEGEAARLSETKPEALLEALAKAPALAPLLSVTALQGAVPVLVKGFSMKHIAFEAQVSSARGAGAAARSDDLVAWLEARGRLDVKAVTPAKQP